MPKRRTRVAIDARYFAKHDTGIYVYLCAVVRLLLDEGFEITLVSPVRLENPADILERCKTVVLPYGPVFKESAWTQVSVTKFLYSQRFDYYFLPANRGVPVFYIGETKLILTVLDLIPLHLFKQYFKKTPVEMLAYVFSTTFSIYKASRIMAVSEATAGDIKHIFRRSATATLIPIRYADINQNRHNTRHANHTKKQFVYNGGRDPRKNVPLLLEGFAQFSKNHRDYKLLLMGGGYDSFDAEIKRLDITHATIKTGYVTQKEKMRILSESAAAVYPSQMEGYGLPIVEAMCADIPIICGTGGSQREVAGKAGLYLEPINGETISILLSKIADGQLPENYEVDQHNQLEYLLSTEHEQKIISQFTRS